MIRYCLAAWALSMLFLWASFGLAASFVLSSKAASCGYLLVAHAAAALLMFLALRRVVAAKPGCVEVSNGRRAVVALLVTAVPLTISIAVSLARW